MYSKVSLTVTVRTAGAFSLTATCRTLLVLVLMSAVTVRALHMCASWMTDLQLLGNVGGVSIPPFTVVAVVVVVQSWTKLLAAREEGGHAPHPPPPNCLD